MVTRGEGGAESAILVYVAAGKRAEAEQVMERIATGNERVPSSVRRAMAHAALRRDADALSTLNAENFQAIGLSQLYFNPVFDPLRARPEFGQILDAMGRRNAHDTAQAWRSANSPDRTEVKN